MRWKRLALAVTAAMIGSLPSSLWAQTDSAAVSPVETVAVAPPKGIPVVYADDTLFSVYSPLGEFVPEERASQILTRLRLLARNDAPLESLRIVESEGATDVLLDTLRVFSVTTADAERVGKSRTGAAQEYVPLIQKALEQRRTSLSLQELLVTIGTALAFLAGLVIAFWLMRMVFPRLYAAMERWEGRFFPTIRFRQHELVKASSITTIHIAIAKGIRLLISMVILAYFLTYLFSVIPWTRSWDPVPILRGIVLTALVSVLAAALVRTANSFFTGWGRRVGQWKGTLIRPVRIKTIEVLSEERIAELALWLGKLLHFVVLLWIGYSYVTIVFSFFNFSSTWAASLFGYIVDPLLGVIAAFVNYLPNIFFIAVIFVVTRFLIRLIKLVFTEIGRGTFTLPGFHVEWADPTFKIVRFLVIVFAAVIVFPYLPGSDSPAFQGISVFLGILFSLGSSSAVANVVSGVVLTYMRPFRIGDRVRISDTVGDVIERTLLVTRVRTITNVDVTIPNAMVLGSHIVNFSSAAKDRGLILHTGVTIGYDAPWRTVHELLLAAASSTEGISKEPAPFVLQTALDDFFVSYELNAYTNSPGTMAILYSELHKNIQDRFNEAGVEIMSPHYTAARDGNRTTVPEDYLPKTYKAPGFRLFPFGEAFGKKDEGDKP